MAVEAFASRKLYEFSWDLDLVKGAHASILASKFEPELAENPELDGELLEKKLVPNDGSSYVTFPSAWAGNCLIVVKGSLEGEDEGVLNVA